MNLDRPTLDYYAPSTSTRGRRKKGVILALLAIALIAALPFLLLQLLLDYGTTGHLFHTPVTMYHQHYWPHAQIGYTGDATDYRPPTDLPQFSDYCSRYIVPSFNEFRDTPALKLLAKVRVPCCWASGCRRSFWRRSSPARSLSLRQIRFVDHASRPSRRPRPPSRPVATLIVQGETQLEGLEPSTFGSVGHRPQSDWPM
jgi:hypothetical protein